MNWQVTDKGRYISDKSIGPYDGDKKSDAAFWEPLAETSFDHFAVLDFGMHTVKNSMYPPTWVSIYARIEIEVPETAT